MSFSDAANLRVRFSTEGADTTQRQIANTGVAVTNFGKLAGAAGTAVGTALGVVAGAGINKLISSLGGLVSTGLDFEAQMANVNSIAQLSDSALSNLSGQVLALAQNPGITDAPAELAAGLYDIASAGFTGSDGLTILENAALAASAGVTDTSVATDALTSALGAYGLGADQAKTITDQMFQAVNDGKITFEQLASNLGNVLPIANSLGIGFDQVGAAFAQMTLQGIGASQAETQISSLMKSALNPTESLTAAVQAQGYASAESLIQQEGLAGFLEVVAEASGGSKESLFELLGTQEAMNAATALGGENLDDYIAELENMQHAGDGAGATQKALEKQMKSARFQIDKARQSVKLLATIGMGALAPAIAKAASGMTSFITKGIIPFTKVIGTAFTDGFKFNELVKQFPEPLQRTVHAFGSLADSAGDLWRAFDERGLDGLLQTFTTGGEGEQIVNALQAIGEEAWGALSGAIVAGASAGVDLGVWTVTSGVPMLGGFLLDVGGDIWEWAKGKMGIGGAETVGDGTGGPESDRNRVTLGDWTLDTAIPSVTGFVSDIAGDLWGWVKGKMGIGTTTVGDGTGGPEFDNKVTLGDWTLDTAIPTVSGWIKDAATDAWPYIKSAANWSADTVFKLGDWSLDTGIPSITGWISGGAKALHDVIANAIYGGTGDPNSGSPGQVRNAEPDGGLTFTIAQIALDVLDAVANIDQNVISDAIQDQIDYYSDWKAEINEWSIILGTPSIEFGGGGGGSDQAGGGTLTDAVIQNIKDAFPELFLGPAGGAGTPLGIVYPLFNVHPLYELQDAALAGSDLLQATYLALLGNPSGFFDLAGFVFTVTDPVFDGYDNFSQVLSDDLNAWGEAFSPFNIDISFDGVFSVVEGFGDRAASALASAAGWLWDGANFLWHLVVHTDTEITDQRPFDLGAELQQDQVWQGNLLNGVPNANANVWGSGDMYSGGTILNPKDYGDRAYSITYTIDADTAPAEAKISDLKGLFGGGSASGRKAGPADAFVVPVDVEVDRSKAAADLQTLLQEMQSEFGNDGTGGPGTIFSVPLAFDNTEAAKDILETSAWAAKFESETYTGKLTFDTSVAAKGYTDAFGWGTTFGQQTFSADLDFDTSLAAAGYTDAFGWGAVFASQNFQASLSFDLSGLYFAESEARRVAQNIANLLPHSPAKEGPLAFMPSFGYIADALVNDLSPMRDFTDRTMGYVRSAVSAQNRMAALDYGSGNDAGPGGASYATGRGRYGGVNNGVIQNFYGPSSHRSEINNAQGDARRQALASIRR